MTREVDASLNFRHDEKGVTPECLYCPLFVTPECLYQGSKIFKNQKKKQKLGFPIKDFGNDVGGGGCLTKFQA